MPNEELLLAALAELKAEMKAQSVTLGQVLDQARRTNGRVNMLEEWRRTVELQQAHDAGLAEGGATAAITKGQLRLFVGGATAIASLAGAIAGVVVKVMG